MFLNIRASFVICFCLALLSSQLPAQDDPFGNSSAELNNSESDPFGTSGQPRRSIPAKAPQTPSVTVKSGATPDLETVLEQRVDFDFDEILMRDVRDVIQEKLGIETFLHQSALDEALDDGTLITFRCNGAVPFSKSLELMLEPHNADYIIDENVIKIISRDQAEEVELLTRRVINVRQLIEFAAEDRIRQYAGDNDPPRRWEIKMIVEEDLVDLVKQTISPDSWDSNGGTGAIESINGLIVVTSSRRVAKSVESLFKNLLHELDKGSE